MHRIFVKDSVSGQCGFADPICPVQITSNNGSVTVVPTGTPQAPRYDLSVVQVVDINVQGVTYNAVTRQLTVTETDGTAHTVDLASLVLPDIVTTLTYNGNGIYTYVNEAGTPAVIDVAAALCQANLPLLGILQCS